MDEFLSVKDAAEYIGKSEALIRKLIQNLKDTDFIRKEGRSVYISKRYLDEQYKHELSKSSPSDEAIDTYKKRIEELEQERAMDKAQIQQLTDLLGKAHDTLNMKEKNEMMTKMQQLGLTADHFNMLNAQDVEDLNKEKE